MRGILGIDLVEMETVSFGNYVSSPLKEGCPRSVTWTFAEVFILNHIRNAQIFSNEDVVFLGMIKFVDQFTDKVFSFVCRPFLMQSRCMRGFLPNGCYLSFGVPSFGYVYAASPLLCDTSAGYQLSHRQKS